MRPTGDMVHKTSNGFIYFEGRVDSIIKYKGQKTSLQLVNKIIETFPEIKNNFTYFDSSTSKLHLFIVVKSESFCESELRYELIKELRISISNLPVTIVTFVPVLPETKHGKIDLKKLMSIFNTTKEILNKGIIEEKFEDIMSSLWKDYTNQKTIVDSDNFILNGGESFSAVQFASEMEWHLQMSLPLLVEKLLNESFKNVKNYIKLCLKSDKTKPIILLESNFNSSQFSKKFLHKKKNFNLFKCFKMACKQGYLEQCTHLENSNSCFLQKSEITENKSMHLNLILKWDFKKCVDASPCIFYSPQFNQHLIFIGSHYGIFSCISIEENVEKWHILVEDRIESSACVSACGNYALFGSYDHHLYCISIADGNIHWKYKTGAEVKSSPSVSLGNTVYFGSHDKHVYAIDIQSGLLIWKKEVAGGSIFSSPAILETLNAFCIGTLDGVLALLDMESGDHVWKYYAGKPLFSSPVVISSLIVVGSTDKYLLCLNFEGKVVFKYSTNEPIFSSVAYLNGCKEERLTFGCHDSYVYCLTLNGDLVWKTLCDSPVYATPFNMKWNNCFYVCVTSTKGTLYILQKDNGKEILSWKLPGDLFSSPVVLNNILAVGCRDNNLYCFNVTNKN